jgi:hypothetical protein
MVYMIERFVMKFVNDLWQVDSNSAIFQLYYGENK